jgi:anthranilate synthase/aminodeoxychorismate synthase-like glutamine amidotransferase
MLIGPGPGDPDTSGAILEWVAGALERRLPFLGVCLGHQALGVALGAPLVRAPRPIHGEAHPIHHTGRGLFAGIASPELFTRYHSLCLAELPANLTREAWTADESGGEVVMAVTHTDAPAWGVQFHPESMLSRAGLALLANFLEMRGA